MNIMSPVVINETVRAARDFIKASPDFVLTGEHKVHGRHVMSSQIASFLDWPIHRVEDALAALHDLEDPKSGVEKDEYEAILFPAPVRDFINSNADVRAGENKLHGRHINQSKRRKPTMKRFLCLILFAFFNLFQWISPVCAGEGHDAGYEWAEQNDITDTGYDEGNSESFNEGVRQYAEEIEEEELEEEELFDDEE